MPRRPEPDPFAAAVGQRIRELREEAGLTIEKLAYESELGSKGHLSSIEKGLVRPTIQTLKVIADHLGVLPLDLLTFPGADERQKLVDLVRRAPAATVTKVVAAFEADDSGGKGEATAQKTKPPAMRRGQLRQPRKVDRT